MKRNPNATCGNCPYWYDNRRLKKQEDEQNAVLRAATEKLKELNVENAELKAEIERMKAAPHTDPEEWLPADNASRKWETVICDNGKEIYAGFRSEAVWYRLGFNGTYPCAAPQRWKPFQALEAVRTEQENT